MNPAGHRDHLSSNNPNPIGAVETSLCLLWGRDSNCRSRHEMTARPTKAPTATPIPSISAQRCLLQSDSGKSVPRPPGTGLDDDSRWGQNRDGRNRNECPCVTRCMLGVTLPGLQRHQQQRLYQASLHKDVCYRATAGTVSHAPLALAWTTTPAGAKTETAGTGTNVHA